MTDTGRGPVGAPCEKTAGATAKKQARASSFLKQPFTNNRCKTIVSPATALIMKNPSIYA
jgi:hypothetical protein